MAEYHGHGVLQNDPMAYEQRGMSSSAAYHAAWMQYLQSMTGVYELEIGKAALVAEPRLCAYCGTKQTAERCVSCGAPNR